MTISALFRIDPGTGTFGTAGVAQDASAAGVTAICLLNDPSGVVAVSWSIFGTHGVAAPTITDSSSQQMSFPVAASAGQAYGIRCQVTGADGSTDARTSAVYVPFANGYRPFFIGETFERDSTYGCVSDLNDCLEDLP